MKKKFILLAMMLLTLIGGVNLNVLNAQDDVKIINGDATSYVAYYPICFNYNYGLSQHIYTSSDIGHAAGVIDKIAFKVNYTSTKDITLYMQNTDMTSFGSSWTTYISYDNMDNMVYSNNSLNTESEDGWLIIDIEDFEYDGTGLLITSVGNTGSSVYPPSGQGVAYADVSEYLTLYKTSSTTFTPGYLNGTKRQPAIKLFFAASVPSVKITPGSIDLGTVRTDAEFFTEKAFEPKVVTVSAKGGATINSITTDDDDDFFKIEFEDEFTPGQDEYTLHINYNRNAETDSKDGNLVVTYDTDKTATISLSADAYAATEGDAIEEPIVVAFTDNAFTHPATDMHDDYILPGEENDGNNGDAVYKFTLENDAVLTANVTGTKPIVAIYNEDFGEKDGPSSDNNYEGAGNDAGPTAPTTFGPYTFDNEAGLDDFTIIDKDNDGYKWYVGNNTYINSSCLLSDTKVGMDNHIVTKNKYLITDNSKLNFKLSSYYQEVIGVEVSENGVDYENVHENVYGPLYTGTQDVSIDLSSCQGKEVYIAIYHRKYDSSYGYKVAIDNLELTGTATNTNQNESIDRVLYPAGTYYLVAAAVGNFTLNLSTETLSAPAAATLTAPANEATEQNNPLLTWTLDKFAEEYQLLLGTTNPPTDVVVDWSAPATSYQTEGLANNTVYYWQVKSRNSVDESSSEVFSFVTPLNKPTNVTASKTNLYPGDETTISWTPAEGATSYNVYVGETKVASEVTETSYTLSGLEYNVNPGHNVTVTANHTLGESAKSDAVVVKMTAKSTVTFTVKNAAGTPVEYASVRIYNGKDQYGEAIVEQIFTTDANGQVVEDLLYLYGDYTGYYYFEVTKAPYATYNYNSSSDYISSSNFNNPTYAKNITLQLAAPTGLAVESDKLYPGDNLVVTWNEIAEANSYKVYVNGTEHGVANTNEYTIENLEYNVTNNYNNGDYVQVKAVYDGIGESAISSEYKYFKVTGYGSFEATVNVDGATMKLEGTDEFGAPQTYTIDADGNGNYASDEVLAGSYTATASAFGYNDAIYNVTVTYGEEASCNFDMTEKPTAPEDLLKDDVAVEEDNNGYAIVTWTGASGITQKYNIYRRNVESGDVELVAEDQNNTYSIYKSYTDADYSDSELVDDGTYQYGVTTMVDADEVILNEGFEGEVSVPSGWTSTGYWYQSTDKHSGVYSVYYYANSNNYTYSLTTKEIDLTDYLSAELEFYYKNTKYSNYGSYYNNTLRVKVKEIGSSTWNITTITTSNVTSYTKATLDLSTYKGKKIQIAFEVYTRALAATYLDDIVITGTKKTESAPVWSNTIKKGGIVFTNNNGEGDGKWETPSNWSNGEVPGAEDEVTIKYPATISSDVNVKYLAISGGALTINSGATLTVTGELVNNDEYDLTINDGAQVFHNSENVKARFAMDIVAPETWSSENKDGWQFIAAPFVNNTAPIANFTSPNFSTIVYDLYKYNGVNAGAEWDNQKNNQNTWGYYFENGVGYLASYPEERTAYLSGTLNNATSFTKELSYNEGENLANFHLLGNPFTFNMDMSKATYTNLVEGYAVVNPDDGGYKYYAVGSSQNTADGTIKVGDGFFVKATGEDPSFSYNVESRAKRGESFNSLNLIATGNAGEDNLIINLAGKQEGFPKLKNFNDDIATLFVENSDVKYGIFYCNENTTEVEVKFHANQMGNYTIAAVPSGKFQTLTLVDRFTGIETNLLVEDYHFTATSSEDVNRFIVKLAVSGQQSAVSDNFVYQSGEELIVDAEGTVQIIDVMGRVVYSDDVESTNNRIDVSGFRNGTYMVRVINGSEVKVEKVVIY